MTPDALLIHERSGLARRKISAADLQLASLAPPLWADRDGEVILNAPGDLAQHELLRCNLDTLQCRPFFTDAADAQVVALDGAYAGDSVFMLTQSGALLLGNRDGSILARSSTENRRSTSRLLARRGLLLLAEDGAAMLGVFRPDAAGFAQQLDALLLAPPSTDSAVRIVDFAVSDSGNWALLQNTDGSTGLYRFDARWGKPVALLPEVESTQARLLAWRDKLLLIDANTTAIRRFSAQGNEETAFVSPMLIAEKEEWQRRSRENAWLRKAGISLPLLLAALALIYALLQWSVLRAGRHISDRSTDLLDPMPGGVYWFPVASRSKKPLRTLSLFLLALPTFAILAGLLRGTSGFELFAFAPALCSAVYASIALRRGEGGRLGLVGTKVIAIDYENRYFYGQSSQLFINQHMLLAPPLTLSVPAALAERQRPVGNTSPGEAEQETTKPADGNSDGDEGHDEKTHGFVPGPYLPALDSIGMLWCFRHPWGLALGAVLAGWAVTATALLLPA